jgi:cell wall-associated NlpC family hydrolase
VQALLNWCIRADLDVDGIAGEKTDHAIRVYQKTYKLAVDGIFGVASKKKAKAIIVKYKPAEKTKGDKIADTAKSYVGKVKYVLGGTSLKTGIDCTGFIIAIYGLNGIKIDNKLKHWGKSIGTDINKAKAGDILTFKHKDGSIAHHAIYVGDGMAVHASTHHKDDWTKDIALSEVAEMSHPLEGIRRRWE